MPAGNVNRSDTEQALAIHEKRIRDLEWALQELLRVTDGTTTVAARQLDIGHGISLTDLGGGEAAIALNPRACRYLKASALGTVATTTTDDGVSANPDRSGWNLTGGSQWSGVTNDRTGSLAAFDSAVNPTWTGEAFKVTQNGGEAGIQIAPGCPDGLVLYSIAATVFSYASPPVAADMELAVAAIDWHFNPDGIDEKTIVQAFNGQITGGWPLLVRLTSGLLTAQNAGALLVPIPGAASVLRPVVAQSSGETATVGLELRLALIRDYD